MRSALMLNLMDTKEAPIPAIARAGGNGHNPAWLSAIRADAGARFTELGYPTTRHEDWKYTSVAPIAETAFQPAPDDAASVTPDDLRPFLFADSDVHRLVFVGGRFAPRLSRIDRLPDGITLGSLAEILQSSPLRTEPHLARHAAYRDQPFTALNTAMFEDGAVVFLPDGAILDAPVHLLFLSTGLDEPTVSHPRSLIVAGANSRATVVETYATIGTGVCFTNAVTEVIAGQDAVIEHCRIERENERAFHVGALHLRQERGSRIGSHAVSLGGGLVRHNVHAVLAGEGCDCRLNGLYVLRGDQHVDNHLRVEHAAPRCSSRECFRGVLDDRSRGVFTGRIVVHQNAQRTDAKQTNNTLLLSDNAQAESRPQLEILADDVKCTHGATVGQVNKDAMFYLRSRGIEPAAARTLLICAFASESMGEVRFAPLRARLEELLRTRLPGAERTAKRP